MTRLLLLCTTLILLALSACEPDRDFQRGDSVVLRLGTDTLSFDTVFTARGSATRSFKVYNDASEPIVIDRIYVEGMTGVDFTFNADGYQGPEAEDVVIWGNDSIFVFVEVEVDPNEPVDLSPFVVEDLMIFETGNTQERVLLRAFGQNANYLNGFRRGEFAQISCDGGTVELATDLPIVVYGSLFVDSCALRIPPGTELYFYGGVQQNELLGGSGVFNDGFIYTFEEGRLELLGTREAPIILRTDRLEEEFAEAPGKYRGIILGPGSRGNRLEHVKIFNSIVGVTCDSLSEVTIENSCIAYSAGAAITGYQSDITVRNSLFHSNFGNAIQVVKGGDINLDHVTVASYGAADAVALLLRNFACNENDECFVAPLDADIRNCVFAGSNASELALLDGFEGTEIGVWDLRIRNSVVKTDLRFLESSGGIFSDFYGDECKGCVNLDFGDPIFRSIDEDDYRPDSLGLSRDLGVFLPSLPLDLAGNNRDTDTPDAGALEFVPGG